MCTFGFEAKVHIVRFGVFDGFANIIFLIMPNIQKQLFMCVFKASLFKAFPRVVRVDNVRVSPIWGG